MINRSFRFQNGDLFGGQSVPDAVVPTELRYGRDDSSGYVQAPVLPEEDGIGDPEARPLDSVAPAPYYMVC